MLSKILAATLLVAISFVGAVEAQQVPEGTKCFVGGKPAKVEAAADYRGGKVFLCCEHCVETFAKDSTKFATLANHQLVTTGQFEQTGCPVSGGGVDAEQVCEVGGVKVAMCCEKCKAKVDGAATEEEKIELVFANASFEKSFAMKASYDLTDVKCFMMPKRDVKEAKFVDHRDGKVFFCCPGCVKKWNKEPAKFETAANMQLVQTGQFKQTACPISGGDVDAEQFCEVDGVKVLFCCGNCKAKVESASTDEAKRELVFGSKMFEKGFAKK
jgi:YHS domain-containing protein